MSRANLSAYGDKNILFVDFSDITLNNEVELAIAEAEAIWKSIDNIKRLKVLLLADFSRTQLNPEILELLLRYSRLATAVAYKHAIVGLKSASIVKDIIRTYTGKEVREFKTKDEAIHWFLTLQRIKTN